MGHTDLSKICEEMPGLSHMSWNTFDLDTKDPATAALFKRDRADRVTAAKIRRGFV